MKIESLARRSGHGWRFLVSGAQIATAQPPTGSLSGTVTDAQGGALPGAPSSRCTCRPATPSRRPPAAGRFVLRVRPGGPYKITVHMAGFRLRSAATCAHGGEITRADFELQLARSTNR